VPALKLRAEDEQDLAVLSAILQDALVAVSEIAYLPDEQRFALVANRFRWEPGEAGGRAADFERTLTGLCIDGVVSVQRRGFDPREQDRILSLLALRLEPTAGQTKVLMLEFAGGSSIRIEVGGLSARLDDLGEPWPTRWRPQHPVAEAE
jgi:hypothetical protein